MLRCEKGSWPRRIGCVSPSAHASFALLRAAWRNSAMVMLIMRFDGSNLDSAFTTNLQRTPTPPISPSTAAPWL